MNNPNSDRFQDANEANRLPRTRSALELGIEQGLHLGAQLYVSLKGKRICDFALGEARAGQRLTDDTLMLWLSSGKPVTAVAIAQLMDRGLLDLDDPVRRFIPEFGVHGKQGITLRHVLTHTAGFRGADEVDSNADWEESLDSICRSSLEPGWILGETAGYQKNSGWLVLGEVARRVDGRILSRYVREAIFEPLGMDDSWIGMPSERWQAYGDRIGPMHRMGPDGPRRASELDSQLSCAACRPGSNARGPARELGRFYEETLRAREGRSAWLSAPTALEFTSRQRAGMHDRTFGHRVDFGLGFVVDSNEHGPDTVPYGYGRHCSRETFGHSGAQSSCAFADPFHGLVAAWVCNGLPGEPRHQKRQRTINSAIYEDLALGSP